MQLRPVERNKRISEVKAEQADNVIQLNTNSFQKIFPKCSSNATFSINTDIERGKQHGIPLRMKWKPERTVRRALVVSEPPIFVHFIPTKARIAPKKPRHTAAIIRPRHTWI